MGFFVSIPLAKVVVVVCNRTRIDALYGRLKISTSNSPPMEGCHEVAGWFVLELDAHIGRLYKNTDISLSP